MTCHRICAALLLLLAAAGTANAYAEFGVVGDRVQWSTRSSDPAVAQKLTKLFDSPGRVYGETGFFSEIGSWERLYYRGANADLRRMIQLAADVPGMEVSVHLSPEQEGSCEVAVRQPDSNCEPDTQTLPRSLGYDWMMHHFTPDQGAETITFYVCPQGRAFGVEWLLPTGVRLVTSADGALPKSVSDAVVQSIEMAAGKMDFLRRVAVAAESGEQGYLVRLGRPQGTYRGRPGNDWQVQLRFSKSGVMTAPEWPEGKFAAEPAMAAARAAAKVLKNAPSLQIEISVSRAITGKGWFVTITRVPKMPGGHTSVELNESLEVVRVRGGA